MDKQTNIHQSQSTDISHEQIDSINIPLASSTVIGVCTIEGQTYYLKDPKRAVPPSISILINNGIYNSPIDYYLSRLDLAQSIGLKVPDILKITFDGSEIIAIKKIGDLMIDKSFVAKFMKPNGYFYDVLENPFLYESHGAVLDYMGSNIGDIQLEMLQITELLSENQIVLPWDDPFSINIKQDHTGNILGHEIMILDVMYLHRFGELPWSEVGFNLKYLVQKIHSSTTAEKANEWILKDVLTIGLLGSIRHLGAKKDLVSSIKGGKNHDMGINASF